MSDYVSVLSREVPMAETEVCRSASTRAATRVFSWSNTDKPRDSGAPIIPFP
jgi:hypothetical protein